jgi:hypothetical protein
LCFLTDIPGVTFTGKPAKIELLRSQWHILALSGVTKGTS